MAKDKTTPLMQQYFAIKEKHPDSILFFQVGDFYELFFEDAKVASSFLAIALTKRGKHKGENIPLCGVPVHALSHYLIKLIKGGFKVALCEQMSKPISGKVVDRAVTKVFTPGTLTDEQMLDNKSASYLLSFYPKKDQWGLIFTELLTAQMFATAIPHEERGLLEDSLRVVESELIRFFPDEVVVPNKKFDTYFRRQGCSVSYGEDLVSEDTPRGWVEEQFSDSILKKLSQFSSIEHSLHQLYWYLKKNQEQALTQLRSIQFYQPEDFLVLDAFTQRNLEIVKNVNDGTRKNTLFSVVDRAVTPMGSRTIKKWLQRPLVKKQAILQRQEVVAALVKNLEAMRKLEELFGQLSDLERIVGRVALSRALLHDYLALKRSLKIVPKIKAVLQEHLMFFVTDTLLARLHDFAPLVEFLECSLNDDSQGDAIIKKGFDQELDRLRVLVQDGQKEILKLEQKEIERTGISSLKIRYNNIAGYYIEVTKPNIKLVPDDYIQQQTLVNRNRYVTEELKGLERDILRARSEIELVEKNVFDRVKREVFEKLTLLRHVAQVLSYLDGLLGFARVAYDNGYVAPTFGDESFRDIVIKKGRHPVVEMACGSSFMPNDTHLTDAESLWVLTGPNMGGKSTYLRQVAHLCLLAQTGSLIPAESAQLPILDRIFTRVGSGDNLAEGKSTFLVEMEEAAAICHQATKRSLIILDEVGRGTSTFDGIALAQSIIEYIVTKINARCLFATHYHELTKIKDVTRSVENYHMTSKKTPSGMLFLHEVVKGVARGSFGIEVAKLAQLPDVVVERAKEILRELNGVAPSVVPRGDFSDDVAFKLKEELEENKKVLRCLDDISLDDLSPRQAFDLIWKLKRRR